jgi:hypothetical protein
MYGNKIFFLINFIPQMKFSRYNTARNQNTRKYLNKSIQKTSGLSKSKLELLGWLNH